MKTYDPWEEVAKPTAPQTLVTIAPGPWASSSSASQPVPLAPGAILPAGKVIRPETKNPPPVPPLATGAFLPASRVKRPDTFKAPPAGSGVPGVAAAPAGSVDGLKAKAPPAERARDWLDDASSTASTTADGNEITYTRLGLSGGGRKVICSLCKFEDGWKHMRSAKVWTDDESYEWHLTCKNCVAQQDGCSVNKALETIITGSVGFLKKKQRTESFLESRQKAQALFPMLDTNKKVKPVTLELMKVIFAELVDVIALKCAHVHDLSNKFAEWEDKCRELGACSDPVRAKVLLYELKDVQDRDVLLAFQGESQDAFQLASSYSDEWACKRTAAGVALYWFRMWYTCLAGGAAWPCLHLMCSKSWLTHFEDPLAPKQRWLCPQCGARQRAKWGVVCEVALPVGKVFCKAAVPGEHEIDMRALHHERTIRPTSPKALYDAVPVCTPTTGAIIVPVDEARGIFRVQDKQTFDAMPTFSWGQIYNLGA